jgi:plasmid stabilization system protein ParE
MPKQLVRTRAADRDLFRHVATIRAERPATARRFLMAVEAAYRRLQGMPQVGAPRASTRKGLEGARIWPVPRFRVFLILYRVRGDMVEIVRVLHASQDITRHLNG